MKFEELTGRKPGEPVPEVDPNDIKTTWKLYRETAARNPGKQFAIGMGAIEHVCKPGADSVAVHHRLAMLQIFVDWLREPLAPWIKDGELDDVLFRAAAQTPMKWMEFGVEQKGATDAEDFLRRVHEGAKER